MKTARSVCIWHMMLALALLFVQPQILVPKASAPTIDGVINEAEWKSAAEPAKGIRLMHDGRFLYLGLSGGGEGLGSINLASKGKVLVLHASAALGTAVYEAKQDGWHIGRKFTFNCRKTDNSPVAVEERSKFLAADGWVANVFNQGSKDQREYKISLDLLDDEKATLAITYFDTQKNENTISWPPATDDTYHPKLAAGWLPEPIQLDPSKWAKVKLAD